MSVCVYDNPSTCRREWWRNGKVEAFVCEMVFYQTPSHMRPIGAVRPFEAGKVLGDPKAMGACE